MPPKGQKLQPNTRATQIFLVRYTSATSGPYGLCLGRGLSERPRHPPAKSASRVQPSMRLRTESRVRLNAARERTACAHSSSCARHGLIIKCDAHACARPRAREFSVTAAWWQICVRHICDVPRACIFNGRPTYIDARTRCGYTYILHCRCGRGGGVRLTRAMGALGLQARTWTRMRSSARLTSACARAARMFGQPFCAFPENLIS